MKKILILSIFLISCLMVSCKKYDNQNILVNVTNNVISSNDGDLKYTINYPNINQEKIDEFIRTEVMNLIDTLKVNYQGSNITVNVDYEVFKSTYSLSYLFNFKIYENEKIKREIKRTFNFDLNFNNLLILNENILQDIYLSSINKKLEKRNIALNKYDLRLLKYIINEKEVKFIIPVEVTKDEEIIVTVPNLRDQKISILDKSENIKQKLVAITIDDGPSIETFDLVNLLNKYNIKATFFLLGERVIRYPNQVEYIYKYDHEIGNHSFSHPDFTKITLSEMQLEIQKTQEVIFDLLQTYPRIFRFPYGSYNQNILNHVDLPVILWDVDSLDWKILDNNEIFRNVIQDINQDNVIIFHDFKRYRKEAIELVIKSLLEDGYKFVTVSEMFNLNLEENIINGKIFW